MSYLVMARRWRPQRFSEVVGQQHVTRTLQRAIQRDRIAHAYLFTGPRGVGKTTTARLLAMAVNDPDLTTDADGLPELNPDKDQNRDIAGGSALDVIEIDGASNNKVDDVRQLRESIKYAPTALEKKVYIIDEVHMLSQAAFNALLKTLEEPPEHAMFIFATTEAHKVPATVLSRCQRYDFKRIPTKDIRQQLTTIVKADELNVSDDALTAISVKADGALRDALSILDQLVAYQGNEPITEEVVRQALGLIGGEIYFRTTDMAATGKVSEALQIATDLTAGGHDAREYLRGLQQHVLRYLFLAAGGSADELAVTEEERDRYTKTLDQLSEEDLLRIGEWAADSEDLLRDALDPVVRLELLLVRIAKMDRAVDVGALLQRMGYAPDRFEQDRVRPESSDVSESSKDGEKKTPDASSSVDTTESQTKSVAESTPENVDSSTETDTDEQIGTDSPTDADPVDDPANNSVATEPDTETGTVTGEESDEVDTPESKPDRSASADTDDPPQHDDEDLPPDLEDDTQELSDEDEETLVSDERPTLVLADIRSDWLEFCDLVDEERRLLGTHLEKGAPVSFENDALEVIFDPSCNFEYENVFKNRDAVERAFRSQFGRTCRVVAKRGSVPEHLRPPKRATEHEQRQQKFEKILEEKPVWKELVERFQLS